MAMNFSHDDFPSGTDYSFEENTEVIGACYIVFSAAGFLLNSLTFVTILKSQRMFQAPKYWLVLIITGAFWVQAVMVNPHLITVWFGASPIRSCAMWVMAKAYNAHVCMGIACWCSLLINSDHLCCMISIRYRYRYRAAVILLSTFAGIVVLITSLCVISVLYGSTMKPFTEVRCHFGITSHLVGVLLIEFTLYIPITGSIIFTLIAAMTFRGQDAMSLLGAGQGSVDIQSYGGYRCFQPKDNVLFLLVLILCYVPAGVLRHLVLDKMISPQDSSVLIHLSAATTVVRDNAGCLVPLVWYCFYDMRLALKKFPCFKGGAHPSDSAFAESSEFRVYDSYPYCASSDMDA